MKKYQRVDRAQFVAARYENFLAKKKYLESNESVWPPGSYHMTDLDRTYEGETKPQKDIVLCDRCNEDINDPTFIMLENSYVYHQRCVQDELPPGFDPPLDNVVFLDDFRKEPDDDDGDEAS